MINIHILNIILNSFSKTPFRSTLVLPEDIPAPTAQKRPHIEWVKSQEPQMQKQESKSQLSFLL